MFELLFGLIWSLLCGACLVISYGTASIGLKIFLVSFLCIGLYLIFKGVKKLNANTYTAESVYWLDGFDGTIPTFIFSENDIDLYRLTSEVKECAYKNRRYDSTINWYRIDIFPD